MNITWTWWEKAMSIMKECINTRCGKCKYHKYQIKGCLFHEVNQIVTNYPLYWEKKDFDISTIKVFNKLYHSVSRVEKP